MKSKSRQANIGMFKQRVLYQKYELSSDGMGGNTQSWIDLKTAWANVIPLSGAESYEIDGLKGKTKYKIITRYRNDLDPTDTWGASEEVFSSSVSVWDFGDGDRSDSYNFLLRAKYLDRTFNIEFTRDLDEEFRFVEMIAVEDINA